MSFYRGYISNYFTDSFTLVLLVLTCLYVNFASAAETTQKSKAKLNNASSSTSKSKNAKQRQALNQGYSASEALLMTQKRWNVVLSQSFARGIDEFADTHFSYTNVDLSYRLNSWSALLISGGYETIALSHDGKLFNNYSADPDRFGLTDLEVGYSVPGLWKNEKSTLNYYGSLTFPSSPTSQNATMVGSMSNSLIFRHRPTSRLMLSANSSLILSQFRRDDADAFGFLVNSPLGLSYGISGSYMLFSWMTGVISYSQFQRLDYDNNWDTIQTVVANLNFILTAQASIYAGYRYRDTIITNDEMFDDDKSLAYIGVSYAF